MKFKLHGFTLIELMIVLVIMAILAGVAVPGYQKHVLKSRRTDALDALNRAAALQERRFFQKSAYASDAEIDELGGNRSSDGHYSISVSDHTVTTYTLRAVPAPGSIQAKDTECAVFTVQHTQKKAAEDDKNNDTTSRCWPN